MSAPDDDEVPPADTGWVMVVEVDPDFFAANEAADPSVELEVPTGAAPREIPLIPEVALIGRGSAAAVDLGHDPAVSHRHATLHRRGDGWVLVDEGSTNGTRLVAGGAPVTPGHEVPLGDGDSVLVGGWTRLTLKRHQGG